MPLRRLPQFPTMSKFCRNARLSTLGYLRRHNVSHERIVCGLLLKGTRRTRPLRPNRAQPAGASCYGRTSWKIRAPGGRGAPGPISSRTSRMTRSTISPGRLPVETATRLISPPRYEARLSTSRRSETPTNGSGSQARSRFAAARSARRSWIRVVRREPRSVPVLRIQIESPSSRAVSESAASYRPNSTMPRRISGASFGCSVRQSSIESGARTVLLFRGGVTGWRTLSEQDKGSSWHARSGRVHSASGWSTFR